MERNLKSSTKQQSGRVTPENVHGGSAEYLQRTCLVDVKEISRLTGIPISTIYKGCRDGLIPFYRLARCLRLNPDEVLATLRKRAEETVEKNRMKQLEASIDVLELLEGGPVDDN